MAKAKGKIKPGDRIVLVGPNGGDYEVWMERVDSARAAHLLAHLGLQRNLKMRQVNRLAETMEAGHWNDLNGDTFVFDTEGRLIQGQHRCQAIIKSERGIWVFCIGGVSDRAIFDIDIDLSARTLGDVLCMRGEKYSSELAAAIQMMGRWARGLLHNYAAAIDSRAAYQMLKRHPRLRDSVAWCHSIATQSPVRVLPASFIAWCHYVFTRVQADLGLQFVEILTWQHEGRPDRQCPAHVLRERLFKACKSKQRRDNLSAVEKVAWTIKGWNLYVQQMRASSVRAIQWPAGEKFPQIVDGNGDIYAYAQLKELPQAKR
jgi:hypothetical protein